MNDFTNSLLTAKKTEPPVIASAAVPQAHPKMPARTSGWSDFFRFCVAVGSLLGVVGVSLAILGETVSTKQSGVILAIVGFASAIQSLFMAFVVSVFTEIRWYLARIAGDR